MMFDYQGELVWDGTGLIGQTMAFQTYVYNSSSVIAVWQGLFNGAGYGDGVSLLVDDTYRIIAEVLVAVHLIDAEHQIAGRRRLRTRRTTFTK